MNEKIKENDRMKKNGEWNNERNKIRKGEDNDRMRERMTIFSSKDSFLLTLAVWSINHSYNSNFFVSWLVYG